MTTATMPSIQEIRAWFPSLASGFAFLENAGGSQVPKSVPEAIANYMRTSYVQLGAGYPSSDTATATVDRAHALANRWLGGEGVGQAIIGPSTTQLLTMLAECYSRVLNPGDRIVLHEISHEANAGTWQKLERFGIRIDTWRVDPASFECPLEALETLLKEGGVKIVAATHVSNLLGGIVDVAEVARLAHAYGAKIVVDGVAFAPHRPIDVAALGVDWYVVSNYKTYGPHMATLFGTNEAIAEIEGPNHSFIPKDVVPYKFQLGGANHELCAGWLGVQAYLAFLAGLPASADLLSRDALVTAFAAMEELEKPLAGPILEWLLRREGVRIIGPGPDSRVPTISFVSRSRSSAEIAAQVNQKGMGIRNGHMYAYRLAKAIGLDLIDGVVRISLVHYNTQAEIEALLSALDGALS